MITIGTITPELYWEWRCAASELNLSKKEKIEQELKLGMMEKDLEIARLKISLFRTTISGFAEKVTIREKDLEESKLKIEKHLGKSLPEGCVINESLEVIQLEDNQNK